MSDTLTRKGNPLANKDWAKKLQLASGKPLERRQIRTGIVYMLIDCSTSMEGDKMVQAKKGVLGFAEQAYTRGYSVGIIKFASDAEYICDPQDSFTTIAQHIGRLTSSGSTNMAEAIEMVIEKFSEKIEEKVICIVTDGVPDDAQAALNAANDAKERGIDIMTIGTRDADKDFLARVATRTELSVKVSESQLESGISSMARLLPGKP